MCVVSYVSDQFTRQPPTWYPGDQSWPPPLEKIKAGIGDFETIQLLKLEIERLKKELEEARKQDIKDNNPDWHMEDKVAVIKGLAKALGVDLGNVFEGHK